MKHVVINFSGHPLSSEARKILEAKFDCVLQPEPFLFDFRQDANAQLKQICANALQELDRDTALTIIPPGQSTLAILLVSYLHGVVGHFPRICYLELGDQGLYLPLAEYEINPQNTRSAGRVFRMQHFDHDS